MVEVCMYVSLFLVNSQNSQRTTWLHCVFFERVLCSPTTFAYSIYFVYSYSLGWFAVVVVDLDLVVASLFSESLGCLVA